MVPLVFALLGALASGAFAQGIRDAAPPNADAVLRELEQIEKSRQDSLDRAKRDALAKLQSGLASGSAASALYAEAVQATRFAGLGDRVSAFVDWRKKNADLLRSSLFQSAVALHLRYLMLSLQRGSSDKPSEFAQPSMSYARDLAAFLAVMDKAEKPPGEARELLDKSVADGVFAQWLGLGPWLPGGTDWEPAAGNLAGILEKNVRVPLRAQKDPRLIETYEFQMKVEADRITGGRLAHAAANFNTVALPRLQHARAKDLQLVGLPNSAASELMNLIRSHPQHPDFGTWVAELRSLLRKPSAEPAGEPPPE